MLRRTIATITAAAAALLVVGVAWASGGDATSTSVTSAEATGTSLDDRSSTSVSPTSPTTTTDDSATSTVGRPTSTSTSLDDRDDGDDDDRSGEDRGRRDDDTTATTITPTTSTSIGTSSSTSHDDSTGRVPPDSRTTYDIPGVGQVTIEVVGGRLSLVDVSAPGWTIGLDKVESDRIEIELVSGDAEARFEARVRGERVEVETEVDTD
ncbi:MAG: hypothetical protein WAL25_13535 [Acidimicrobiia bacterium]